MIFTGTSSLKGEITIPGDKSISHRAIMLGAISDGTTRVKNFLQGADCLSTIECFRKMGVSIKNNNDGVIICGNGLHGLRTPQSVLDAGNSGTTTRLISGILSAQNFTCRLDGDASLRTRPMNRIITPLSEMGADIKSINENGCVPLRIKGCPLHGISYNSPVASAQVKSAILLAGLYACGDTSVTEPYLSRNHSELMLKYFGADIRTNNTTVTISPAGKLTGGDISVPGDISSAAYFIVAGLIVPNSEILIKNVGINKTRDGILRIVQNMGGNIKVMNRRNSGGEDTADLFVKSGELHATEIGGEIIPTLIDEIPVIAVLSCFAKGTTVIKDAAELKVKESDRIGVMVENLSKMGADISATDDGMIINGGRSLHGAVIDSKLDHRIAMSFAIASLMASGETEITGADAVKISYPDFFKDLDSLKAKKS